MKKAIVEVMLISKQNKLHSKSSKRRNAEKIIHVGTERTTITSNSCARRIGQDYKLVVRIYFAAV